MSIDYWYEGHCPQSGERLRLPRTKGVEAIAHTLMQYLATDSRYAQEGKMYGVLLTETLTGEPQILKAFSGLLKGNSRVEGWVPPIPGRDQIALVEAQTLIQLDTIKNELIALQHRPEKLLYTAQMQEFATRLQQLVLRHDQQKQERHHQRQIFLETLTGKALERALELLNEQSRQDGIERRNLKRQRTAVLQPLEQQVQQVSDRLRELKQQRKALSQQLQAQMHANYWLTNFAGESLSLQALIPGGAIPTGTGDCCAPKLLHYAATQKLKPLAMAEFWWGPSPPTGDKVQGEFYGACAERCQPLMGFLLSGLSAEADPGAETPTIDGPIGRINMAATVAIIYEDPWLIAVNKPAGLLSVPGRYRDRQDSVLNRLRYEGPNGMSLRTVHRLDQETSGILLLARDKQTHRHLSHQFQQRTVRKVYEAVLAGTVTQHQGMIELPLWGDPGDRPAQKVDEQRGKASITHFQAIATEQERTRVKFFPITGRTHQIRVHAADPRGLGVPVLGDRLYGCPVESDRLHLHARELQFEHPHTGEHLHLTTETPF